MRPSEIQEQSTIYLGLDYIGEWCPSWPSKKAVIFLGGGWHIPIKKRKQ